MIEAMAETDDKLVERGALLMTKIDDMDTDKEINVEEPISNIEQTELEQKKILTTTGKEKTTEADA